MFSEFASRLHKRPWLSLGAALLASILALKAAIPLRFDFSFTALFVGEGEAWDTLRDYVSRFGTDVNFVMLAVESDTLFSWETMEEIRALGDELGRLEGVTEVISPTSLQELWGDGGSIQMLPLVPQGVQGQDADWDDIRRRALAHPIYGGTIIGASGRHAAIIVQFGVESALDACNDGIDNDGEGDIDCQDPGCWAAVLEGFCSSFHQENTPAACTNGIDDDGDGLVDCEDPDCQELRTCAWKTSAESGRACSDGIDNDGDGLIDCADPDCVADPRVQHCNTTAAVLELVERWQSTQVGSRIQAIEPGGVPVVSRAYTTVLQHDLRTYVPITGALIGLMLLALFRSVLWSVLPLVIVAMSMLWTMGVMMGTGGKLNMINSSMPTLLLVIAVADAVHVVSRYIEESGNATSSGEAVSRTMRQMAMACLLTSITSAVGFGSLLTAHLPVIRSFGGYTAFGIMLGYLATILVLPSVLGLFPLPSAKQRARTGAGGSIANWIVGHCRTLVFERPVLGWALILLLMIPGIAGALKIEADQHLMEEVRDSHPVALANAVIEEHHGGVLGGAILLKGPPGTFAEPEVLEAMLATSRFAQDWRWREGETLVSKALSLANVVEQANEAWGGTVEHRRIPDTRAAVMSLLDQLPVDERAALVSADYSVAHITFRMLSVGSNAWSSLRKDLTEQIQGERALDGVEWSFTGSSTLGQDAMLFMTQDLFSSLAFAFVIILVLMSLLFRSLRVGLISMIPNLFPLLITAGVVGYMGINIRVSTAVVFSIALGIAVDDTIHVLARFREEIVATPEDYAGALWRTLQGTAKPVVFTTLMIGTGFAVLTLSEFTAVRELGFLGVITLLAALVGDLVLLPLLLLRWRPRVR